MGICVSIRTGIGICIHVCIDDIGIGICIHGCIDDIGIGISMHY